MNGGLNTVFERRAASALLWLPEEGIGYFPVAEQPYDESYFAKYQAYADTTMGKALTRARVELVNRYHAGPLIDVGIGCGQFVDARPNTFGYDINPTGITWLRERGLLLDPESTLTPAMSFWDSLEHIPDPSILLANAMHFVFVSLPIFRNADHVLTSKHFRKDEHFWYFTRTGFIGFMRDYGFECLEVNGMESDLGREDIETYVFRRAA